MVHDILVVDMVVCNMQVWCGCALSKAPLNFKNHDCNSMYGHGFCMYAMVCMDMDYFLLLKSNKDYNKLHWHEKYKYT